VRALPREGAKVDSFHIHVGSERLDWQVTFIAQIFDTLGSALSSIESFNLQFEERESSLEGHNDVNVDPTLWPNSLDRSAALRPFSSTMASSRTSLFPYDGTTKNHHEIC
jgi:hypothetical protein